MTNRILLGLVLLTLCLQGVMLFNQYHGSKSRGQELRAVTDAPKGASFDLNGHPIEGTAGARTIIVEFSDYQCPFCSRHANGVALKLKKKFIDTGKLKHVFVNNPLPMHPNAKLLASIALCAGDQGKYWEMHDTLFKNNPDSQPDLNVLAQSLNISLVLLQQCIEHSGNPEKQIDKDIQLAKDLKFNGTPSFAIGIEDIHGHVLLKKLISGAQPLDVFESSINEVESMRGGN